MEDLVKKVGGGSAKRKRCIAKLARLCAVENLNLHMGIHLGFVKFMSQLDPRWQSISNQNVTTFLELQIQAL